MKRHFSLLNATTKMTVALVMGSGLTAWHHSAVAADDFSLKMSEAIAPDRFFIRAGVIGVKVKTEAEDTYDVTGPIITTAELDRIMGDDTIRNYVLSKGATLIQANLIQDNLKNVVIGIPNLKSQMERAGLTALGTPTGIKSVAQEELGTAGLSLGYFLDDEYKWVVEAYVLAKPVTAKVNLTRPSTYSIDPEEFVDNVEKQFGMKGKTAITSKLLPPTVVLGRYFGAKDSVFRPFVGALAMYGLFYDVKVSDAMNAYVGGGNPGDTTASFKNTFGMGPMLGLKVALPESWHVSLNVGHVKLKTVGRVVTRNTVLTTSTPAVADFGRDSLEEANHPQTGGSIYEAALTAEAAYADPAGSASKRYFASLGGVTRVLTAANFVATKGVENPTFVREAKATLSNTLFFLSVGRSF